MTAQAFKAHACRLATALGAIAGGLSLDGMGLPAPVSNAVGGMVAAALFMSARLDMAALPAHQRRASAHSLIAGRRFT